MSEKRIDELHADLRALHERLRSETIETHQRINSFAEDLFDWKERGEAWEGAGENVTIYNSAALAGDITIGHDTWIGPYVALDGPGGLTIGHHCSISWGCQIYTHDTARWALSGGRAEYEYAPTSIGDCCFLGAHVIVTKGVKVGDRCLIATGSVVTEDLADDTIAAGVPAKPIGKVKVDDDGNVDLEYF